MDDVEDFNKASENSETVTWNVKDELCRRHAWHD